MSYTLDIPTPDHPILIIHKHPSIVRMFNTINTMPVFLREVPWFMVQRCSLGSHLHYTQSILGFTDCYYNPKLALPFQIITKRDKL